MQQQFEEAQTPSVLLHLNNEATGKDLVTLPQEETVESLLEALRLEAPKRVKRRRRITVACSIGFVLYITLIFVDSLFFHVMSTTFYSYMSIVPLLLVAMAATERREKLAKQLAQYDDKRAVGPLVEALGYYDPLTVNAAITALTRLLPELRASDRHLLNDAQRTGLNNVLLGTSRLKASAIKPELALAILKALGQVGDAAALPAVEKVANGGGIGKNSAVRLASAECLPFLQEVARHEAAQKMLLRASGPGASPEALLRPASSEPDDPTDQLLRATRSDANN